MTVKEQTAQALLAQQGVYLSGGELSRALGVSRNAIWKAVRALQEEGYPIDAVPNRGYCLRGAANVLSAEGIATHLQTAGLDVRVFDTVDSTNRIVKEWGAQGLPEGTVAVAGQQTAGRGRLGRAFFSPSGTGVYFSILLRPPFHGEQALLITTAAAVAVARAIERVAGREAKIKWVNDVYLDDRKVCGILTEASMDMESGALEYAVLGIGVNVILPQGGFPPPLHEIAAAVFDRAEGDERCRLVAAVLDEFFAEYARLEQRRFVDEYRRRSLLDGRVVTVKRGERTQTATVRGVDEQCRLLVTMENGEQQTLSSGEVSIALQR